MGRTLPWLVGLVVVAGGIRQTQAEDQTDKGGQCTNLYTDDEAKAIGEVIKKAVPRRQFKRKDLVLKKIGVDSNRLCNRRQGGANLGYKICWQISPSYDLTWWLSADDGPPGERDDRRIYYSVGMMQRQPSLPETRCPMTDEERGVKKRKAGMN